MEEVTTYFKTKLGLTENMTNVREFEIGRKNKNPVLHQLILTVKTGSGKKISISNRSGLTAMVQCFCNNQVQIFVKQKGKVNIYYYLRERFSEEAGLSITQSSKPCLSSLNSKILYLRLKNGFRVICKPN